MNPIKRRYYFDSVGRILFEVDLFGETPIEKDITDFKVLSERNRDTFDVLELPFGAYAQDFIESNGYRVNPETKELEFSYPDPNEPEVPPVFIKPLTEQIEELKIKHFETNQVLAESGAAQQDLLELLIDMGVI